MTALRKQQKTTITRESKRSGEIRFFIWAALLFLRERCGGQTPIPKWNTGLTPITSVTIPNSITSIGSYAFKGCSKLTSVTIPNGVTSIGSNAFQNCSSLTTVTIGSGTTSIGIGAFQNCSSLTNVTIPSSVTSIGSYAFKGCSSLATVNYRGTKAQWSKISISLGNDCIKKVTYTGK